MHDSSYDSTVERLFKMLDKESSHLRRVNIGLGITAAMVLGGLFTINHLQGLPEVELSLYAGVTLAITLAAGVFGILLSEAMDLRKSVERLEYRTRFYSRE